MVTVQACY